MTVEELAGAAAAGSEDAFAQLVDLHEKRVYALALRMTGNPEDAEDVAQEAFLSAWKGLPNFRGDAGFSTWLYRLTSNAAIDFLRKHRRPRSEFSLDGGIPDLPDPSPSPQDQAEAQDLREADRYLGEITGAVSSEEILHSIFARYCIGK